MAQPGQFPINPMNPMMYHPTVPVSVPVPVPVPASLPLPMPMPMPMPRPVPTAAFPEFEYGQPSSAAGKRRREDELVSAEDESAAKRRVKLAQDVLFRIVVPSRQIGKVIGKEGCRIQKIREDTKATIKIADAIARHEERVIIISSKDSDNKLTDAENALQQIATLILKEDESSTEAKVAAGHVAANTIRLLIAGTQAGCLIGISGQNIEKLRDSCGAIITILAQNQLPLCASAHESDRVVQISGDVPAVLKALEEIGSQLRENPPRQVISISPVYNITSIRPPQPYLDPTSGQPILQLIMLLSR
ncbi:RNA-binding KH domain-containing protein PEPPER-like isoform X2 [Quercus robur]|uniref:RNA-binding KH domain-containing protein PEPPER-like isoform X2 n=1 Tax=Quercus robur TaxID=38942 RepID=UPI002162B08C|nr:RNA-binding KH domain-containing protein PEPPER-like isoform X2 [Quercus robur]